MPGDDWKATMQQNLRAHAFQEDSPATRGARKIQSTTTKKLFERDDSSKTLILQITPLASVTDAEDWVRSAPDRVQKGLANVADVSDFRIADEVSLENVEHVNSFEYISVGPKGLRPTRAIAANFHEVYLLVIGGSLDQWWTWGDLIEVANVQVRKIASLITPMET